MKLPEVHYRLKPADYNGDCLIYLQFIFHKQRLFYSFGQKVKASEWNIKKERVKSDNQTTKDGKFGLNDLLNGLETECQKVYREMVTSLNIPTPEALKTALDRFRNKVEGKESNDRTALFGLIERFIKNEILSEEGKMKADNTIKIYRTTKKYLLEFEAQQKTKLTYDSINLDLFYVFVKFLKEKGLGQNAISKYIQTLKLFMEEAVTLGYTNNLNFKHKKFKVKRVQSDAVYLNEAEINRLYKHDFSDNKRLDQVRDLFVFGCWVGLRYSDYSRINANNIVEIDGNKYIKIQTTKTKERVIVPCNKVVLEIFDKYKTNSNFLPRTISEQKFNDYIKEACQIAGLTQKGRLSTALDLELWECISSHTSRRSFCTNYYLRGVPIVDIMKFTGHKSEKVFLNYIKSDKLETAKRLHKHNTEWENKKDSLYVVA